VAARERDIAVRHFVRVIRDDDGNGALAAGYQGLPYRTLLAGTDAAIPDDLRLPLGYRVSVKEATNDEIVEACARLVRAYLESLQFSRDDLVRL
jgi:hypothetical protein